MIGNSFAVYSGFIEPRRTQFYEDMYEPTSQGLVEDEIFNFWRQAKEEVESVFSEVPNLVRRFIPKIRSYGTTNLNLARL